MTDQIKEATKILKQRLERDKEIDGSELDVEYFQALQTAISILELHQKVSEGMPKKRDYKDLEFPHLQDYSKGYYDGFNEAHNLCTAHFARMMDAERIKSLIDKWIFDKFMAGRSTTGQKYLWFPTEVRDLVIERLSHAIQSELLKKE